MAAAKLLSVLKVVEIYGVRVPTAFIPDIQLGYRMEWLFQFGKHGQLKRVAGSLRSRRLKITGVGKNGASKGPRKLFN